MAGGAAVKIEKKQTGQDRQGLWLGVALVLVGIVLGSIARPLEWLKSDARDSVLKDENSTSGLHQSFQSSARPDQESGNGLKTIYLEIPTASANILQKVRDRAMDRKMIVQEASDTVPATVEYDGQELKADIRIKGDWTDHVSSDKWSYRIKLKGGKLMGMRVFSVQNPQTRGYLWEWVVLEAARREGLLAPRCDFVNMVINGNPMGVYFLEEHFSKELLESQGRREGPIVVFDESTLWSQWLLVHFQMGSTLPWPKTFASSLGVSTAETRAFGEKKLEGVPGLQASLDSALEKMGSLRNMLIANTGVRPKVQVYASLDSLQGATIDNLFNTDMLARWLALTSVFRIEHSIIWHNMRFYYDPVQDRLEPVMFDNMPHHTRYNDITMFKPNRPILAEFRKSHDFYTGVFRYLADFCQSEWLDDLFADLEPRMDVIFRALDAENPLHSSYHPTSIKQVFRGQQIYLKESLYPKDPVNFSCVWDAVENEGNVVSGTVTVTAWATSASPVVLEGFRFANGSFVKAAACFPALGSKVQREGDHGIVLPLNKSPLDFTFSLDERLANLENVQQLKSAIRSEGQDEGTALDLDIKAVFRPFAATETMDEKLRLRRRLPAHLQGGRPQQPTLLEALETYPCLQYDIEAEKLSLRPGQWDLEGDLLIPAGVVLHANPGTILRFREDAILLTDSALIWAGTKKDPVILEPQPGLASWSGIVVLGANKQSHWRNVTVRSTNRLQRGGWATTGGITFYHSPVEMFDCRIENTVAEDGLNIFGCETLLDGVTLTGCISDSFDGDFITGTIRNCRFEEGMADGLDVSGSDILVENCTFFNLADKGISVGEKSRVRVVGGSMENVAMGVVSKDLSEATVTGMEIHSVVRYALAAYIKKPEFGPATIIADSMKIGSTPLGVALVQNGSSVTLDGQGFPTVTLDVKALYREGILGN
jgi:CotH kinase protein/Right handed beta helix region